MAQTPMAYLCVMDMPMKRALSKGLVGGGHLSRGERARALCQVVPAVAAATHCQRELGTRAEGAAPVGRSTQQGEEAAEAGRAVACRRAVCYTATQQLNITQCFLALSEKIFD